jgi:DNA-directed RNA polymerase subunit RPC12/RpoP
MAENPLPVRRKISLRLVESPSVGAVVTAPPPLTASTHTIDYCCAHCGTVLMHAEADQVNNLLIRCTACGAHNSTDQD